MADVVVRDRATRTGGRVERLDPMRLAQIALAVCAVIGALSRLPRAGFPNTYPLDLDAEYRVASTWSTFLYLAAAWLAFEYGRAARSKAAIALGAFFAYMAVDEFVSIHERLEKATGVDWQVLYLPLVALGGVVFLVVLREMWVAHLRSSAALLLGGGALWFVAQILEKLQWDGDVEMPGYDWMSTTEELLEMVGSLLFALAALVALQAALKRRNNPSGADTSLS